MTKRVLGDMVAVSVATAVPLEVMLKSEKPFKQKAFYLNLRTLFRNFHGAFADPDAVELDEFVTDFINDIKTTMATINNTLPGEMTAYVYLQSYRSIETLMPYAKVKKPHTTKQRKYAELEEATYREIRKTYRPFWDSFAHSDCLLKGDNSVAFILTHLPFDLLSSHTFRDLTLVESHTGEMKVSKEWNTKLTNPEKYGNLPFCPLTIQVIGDNSNQFYSLGGKYIRTVEEIAATNKWTPSIGLPKIKFDIDRWRDKFSSEVLKLMVTVKLR